MVKTVAMSKGDINEFMNNNQIFRTDNRRTMRFLYNLGFDKTSEFVDGKEVWTFERCNELNESLDFYFYMRKKIRRNLQEK